LANSITSGICFSTDATKKQTYFFQWVNSFTQYDAIYRSAFTRDDISDLSLLAGKLKSHPDPVSQFLWDNFAAATQQLLTTTREPRPNPRHS